MKPYKLKHIPTGLYYQPYKHRGSHLSKNGKIYQTNINGIETGNSVFRLNICCQKDSRIHKQTKDILDWQECSYNGHQMMSGTNFEDWIREEI